tara:strand:+ start:2679 stop:3275 length:597 start_codon:yes stop_codon:yes gene_type:complete
MKSVLKKLMKGKNKFLNIFLLLALVAVVGVLYKYNSQKSVLSDNMADFKADSSAPAENLASAAVSSAPLEMAAPAVAPKDVGAVNLAENKDQFAAVKGLTSGNKPTNVHTDKPVMDPKELLPSDNNNEWSSVMPNNDLKNVGMLNAGHHVGINTVGSSLRNANLQVRSEPVIPQNKNIGPWNNTTIEADNLRRPLEIG